MSAKTLLEMTESISSALTDTQAIRDKIFEEFDAAKNEEERCSLLAMLKATTDIVSAFVARSGDPTHLASFNAAREADYVWLLQKELHVDSDPSPEALMRVTSRESAAGRLTPDVAARLLAPQKTTHFDYTTLISTALTETQAIRDRIFKDFDAADTVEKRSAVLVDFKGAMDIAEFFVMKSGDTKRLADFRETRADDYTRLLMKESTVDGSLSGIVSPEMLMAVTNREIAAGRLAVDDPIRQVALKAAASPHLSHAELLAKAEARKASDMSIQSLVEEMKTATNKDIVRIRERLFDEFDAAATSEQRGTVLALFTVYMDAMERGLAAQKADPKLLEDFRKARAKDYNIFIVKECTVGLDTPVVGGDVSVDKLLEVTNRETVAGRMTEDHSLRKAAVEAAAAPHMSHAELVAKHAKLKAEAAQSNAAPVSKAGADDRAKSSYALGATLGRKLKGLFGK
jgi:hypothetical protein